MGNGISPDGFVPPEQPVMDRVPEPKEKEGPSFAIYRWIHGARHDVGRIVVFESTPADLVAVRSILTGEHFAAYVGTLPIVR